MVRNFLLVIFLAVPSTGCSWFLGIERTDLSSVRIGTSRSDIEETLGKPIERQPYAAGEVDTYEFNIGYHGVIENEYALMEILVPPNVFGAPLVAVMGATEEPSIREEQRGYVTIAYGPDDVVIGLNGEATEEVITLLDKANKGDLDAQFKLGSRTDIDNAFKWKWLCVAAHGGHALAQEWVADRYRLGLQPVGWDPGQAYAWYSRSGTPAAQARLTQMAASMSAKQLLGAEKLTQSWQPDPASCDDKELWNAWQKRWDRICLGAHQNDPNAMAGLGHSYEEGIEGHKTDLTRAYVWYRLAEKNGVVESGSYYVKTAEGWECCGDKPRSEHLAEMMTPEEIAEAEGLLGNWHPNPAGCEIQTAESDSSSQGQLPPVGYPAGNDRP